MERTSRRWAVALLWGDADAQFDLGWKHHEGNGAPKDNDEAARWFRRAADQGHRAAQVRLGNLYEWGPGVPEDPRVDGSLVMELTAGRRTVTRTFTLRNTSELRRLEVSTKMEGAPTNAPRLAIYDEEPSIP